uniref:Uncharacterized protein n=1 Tax=Arundo donax TaxID=35708 RepID=A0A0A9HAY2_ARUDO
MEQPCQEITRSNKSCLKLAVSYYREKESKI